MALRRSSTLTGSSKSWVGDSATLAAHLQRLADLISEDRQRAVQKEGDQVRQTFDDLGTPKDRIEEYVNETKDREDSRWEPLLSAAGTDGSEYSGTISEISDLTKTHSLSTLLFWVPPSGDRQIAVFFRRTTGVTWRVLSNDEVHARVLNESVRAVLSPQLPWWWRAYTNTFHGVMYFVMVAFWTTSLWLLFPSVYTGWTGVLLSAIAVILAVVSMFFAVDSSITAPKFEVVKSGTKARSSLLWVYIVPAIATLIIGGIVRAAL